MGSGQQAAGRGKWAVGSGQQAGSRHQYGTIEQCRKHLLLKQRLSYLTLVTLGGFLVCLGSRPPQPPLAATGKLLLCSFFFLPRVSIDLKRKPLSDFPSAWLWWGNSGKWG